MIHRVTANKPSFREVRLKPGFNLIVADRTKESTKKGSRNGLGKSTLIEIIHFCLGSKAAKGSPLRAAALEGWEFTLDLDIGERRIQATRSVSKPRTTVLTGNTSGLKVGKDGNVKLAQPAWRDFLGDRMFGVETKAEAGDWSPGFRSAISYFARRGKSAYLSPFSQTKSQQTWDMQVHSAFLLGLSWEDAQAVQVIRQKEKVVRAMKAAAKAGFLDSALGNLGKLEADRVRVKERVELTAARLHSFRVHEEYHDIEVRASKLTAEIHRRSNANVIDTRRLSQLQQATTGAADSGADLVAQLYEAAGVQLPGMVKKRLVAVKKFHLLVVTNRREFLQAQLEEVAASITARTEEIRSLSDDRASLLSVLEAHGALEEYTGLQQRHLETIAELKDIESAVAALKKFEVGQTELKIEKEQLHQRSRIDFEARIAARERAIRLFNAHSQVLYDAPGRLLIDVALTGFKFDIDIERSQSDGVDAMQIFCYDLTLAELWAKKAPTPGFLIHDSRIFHGVDERQFALALVRAEEISRKTGFQYLCALNSDSIPRSELSDGFDFDAHVRLRLTDAHPEGCLLGFRY